MSDGFLPANNHRGIPVPRSLGVLFGAAGACSAVIVGGLAGMSAAGRTATLAAGVVLIAGIVDDLSPGGPRGLRGHLRSLAAGRLTTGILKAAVLVACAIVTVAAVPGRSFVDRLLGVLLIAAAGNLWNGLDVAPGRAIKAFLPAAVAALAMSPIAAQPALPGMLIFAVPALIHDLRERGMLGDGGSNLLGFVVGVGAYLASAGAPLAILSTLAIAGNLVAETVGLSAVIARTRVLRSIDGWGRLPEPPR